MSLRSDAIAAYQATQADRIAAARAVLAGALAPADCSGLSVEYDADGVVVFTDGDVHLAVSGDAVTLVEFREGDTAPTRQAGIDSLAALGKALPDLDPVDENAAAPAWKAGVAYKVGDEVTYAGATYECLQAHTSQAAWTPSATPALWKAA